MKKIQQVQCLPHCYKDEKLIYLLIGFFLGVGAYILADYTVKKAAEVKDSNNSEPE